MSPVIIEWPLERWGHVSVECEQLLPSSSDARAVSVWAAPFVEPTRRPMHPLCQRRGDLGKGLGKCCEQKPPDGWRLPETASSHTFAQVTPGKFLFSLFRKITRQISADRAFTRRSTPTIPSKISPTYGSGGTRGNFMALWANPVGPGSLDKGFPPCSLGLTCPVHGGPQKLLYKPLLLPRHSSCWTGSSRRLFFWFFFLARGCLKPCRRSECDQYRIDEGRISSKSSEGVAA